MLNVKKKTFFVFFFLLLHLPIFFINNIWDGTVISYGFNANDISGVKNWYTESSSNFQFIIIKILYFLHIIFNISAEIIFDLFTITTILLFSIEIKKFAVRVFKLNKENNSYFLYFALIFPVWHSLTEINLTLYLFCFYLAFLGYRFFVTANHDLYKLAGILLIYFSFSIKSNFTFVIAIVTLETFYNYFVFKKKTFQNFVLIYLISISGYLINLYFYPPFGVYENYNRVDLTNFDIKKLFLDIKNFYSFFIFYLIPGLALLIIFKKKKFFLNKIFVFKIILILLFSFVTIVPYLLTQKSINILFFTGFQSRHAYLISASTIFFIIHLFDYFRQFLKKKHFNLLLAVFCAQSIFILEVSYLIKLNDTIIEKNIVQQFKNLNEPKSGHVIVYAGDFYRNYYAMNYLLYKSFEKAAWKSQVLKKGELESDNFKNVYDDDSTKKKIHSIKYIFKDFQNNCLTIYEINDEIDFKKQITNFYILNQKNKFILKKISEKC